MPFTHPGPNRSKYPLVAPRGGPVAAPRTFSKRDLAVMDAQRMPVDRLATAGERIEDREGLGGWLWHLERGHFG